MLNYTDCVPLHDKLQSIRAVAFDADDTLWELQNHFEAVEHEYCRLLAPWGSSEEVSAELFATETANMADMGYGCKAFTISLVENAVRISRGDVTGDVVGRIVELGRSLLHINATPLEGVEPTLRELYNLKNAKGKRRLQLALFTKGELLDQENKLHRSGLAPFFDVVSIVSDKTEKAYRDLCAELEVTPSELLMVGNSFKSDIAPALQIGAYAVHVPFRTIWAHEKTEEFEHERLWRFDSLQQLKCIL